MAFSRTGWQPIGGQAKSGVAPAMWSYTSTDAKTDIDAAGYFNDVAEDVSVGDIIILGLRQVHSHSILACCCKQCVRRC